MYLELKHLRTLAELEASGSLGGAAKRLHLTQSALSHQIKALEEQIGQRLFERKSRPLRLTAAGVRLLELAHRVLPEVGRAEADLTRLAEGLSGRLHIIVECHSCFDWLLPAMDAYRRDWPEVELDLITSRSFAALPALAEGRVDLVVTSDPVDDPVLTFTPLFRFEVLLALARNHPLAAQGRSWVRPQELADQTLITYPVERIRLDIFRRFLEPAGVEPADVRTSELSVMILQLVKSGRGISALPNWVLAAALAERQISTLSLGAEGIWSTLYAARRRSDGGRLYLESFVKQARQTAQQVLSGIQPV